MSRKIKILISILLLLVVAIAAYFLATKKSFDIAFVASKNQGVIIYKLEYLDKSDITTLLPTEMTIHFKKNNMHQKVVGWSNIFSLEGIRNVDKKRSSALFKVLGKKFVYTENNLDQVVFGYDPYKGMKLVPTNETKTIAGYLCKKVKVTFPNKDFEDFDIYYTNKIKLDKPNWNNPFYQIDGVLMEYQIVMFGIRTKIVADSIAFIKVDDSEFEIPIDYKKVTKEEIEEEINKLL